jgi:hypothetical protein
VISGLASSLCRECSGWNPDCGADKEGEDGKFDRCWIVRQDYMRDRLLEAEGLAEVSVRDAGKVATVLKRNWKIEPEYVA